MAFTLTLAAGYCAGLFPALAWHNAPAGTQSFVLLCHDPEAAGGDRAYWLRYDLDASQAALPEGDLFAPGRLVLEAPATPPREQGGLLYFELYALDIPSLTLPAEADWEAVDSAMEGHLLSRARLTVPLERTLTHDD